jgi:Na+/H+-dicarboxylate symporter
MDLEMHPPQEPAHPPADLSSFGLPATSSASREPTFYDRYKKFFIIAGAGAGVVIGLIAKASEASSDTLLLIGYAGELYINALMLMVVPYICCSMLVSQRPDLSSTDSSGMGKTALACYACTTALAVVEALIFTNIFAPGDIGVPAHHGKQEPKRIDLHDLKFYSMQDDRGRSYIVADTSFSNSSFQSMVVTGHPSEELWALPSGTGTAMESILSIGNQILPRNVIKTYYSTNLLGLIVFNLLLGQAIAKQPREKSEPVFDGIATVADALMSVVLAVVEFTPIGIGSLIAKGMGNPNDNDMAPYLMFIVMALSAQACHMCLLGAALKTLSNINVPMYYSNLRPAMMMAIATDSSAAALPVTMACGQTNRLHQRTIDLVFPLGATYVLHPNALRMCTQLRNVLVFPIHKSQSAPEYECTLSVRH